MYEARFATIINHQEISGIIFDIGLGLLVLEVRKPAEEHMIGINDWVRQIEVDFSTAS